jgi:mRNA-degrading endonuclease toxin of MazEF toxin-antitoxin module
VSVEPQCGEVWLLDEATVLPGGMLALVVSGPLYNAARPRRLIVEVVTETLPSAGALLAPLPARLAQLGVAIIGEPMTVPLSWFPHPDGEPIATLTADEIDPITDALRTLIGRRP